VWEGRDVVSECSVVDLVNEDPEEGRSFAVWIGLKLRINLDDKRGGYGREQTGLMSESAGAHHNLTGLTKIKVVFKSSSCFFRNSLSYSSATFR
jgi:hypothetical protein